MGKWKTRRKRFQKTQKAHCTRRAYVACVSVGEAIRQPRSPAAHVSYRASGGAYRPFLVADQPLVSEHGSDTRLCPSWHGPPSANSLAKVLAVLAELYRFDVLGTRAFLALTFRESQPLAVNLKFRLDVSGGRWSKMHNTGFRDRVAVVLEIGRLDAAYCRVKAVEEENGHGQVLIQVSEA